MRKLLFLIFLLSIQCRHVIQEEIADCPNLALTTISYSMHIYPVITKTCAIPQCHTVDFEHGNFGEFADLKLRADDGKLVFMIDSHEMPHGFTEGPGYLTTCEIETIKKWISQGALNN